ncbi:hypothetical protein AAF712_007924 [Marasmius tenuissimus]|uniref:Uncharacterized protein n=1 Tax=Marasmius tenuissimus TaxID=585030 RepID=A0ABR2ZWB9_9AGAR
MDPQPFFANKRKRKRRSFIDPCLGFYAQPDSESSSVDYMPRLLDIAHEEAPAVAAEAEIYDAELPGIVALPEKYSESESDVQLAHEQGDAEELESPKPIVEITVESFLRSHGRKSSRRKPKSGVKTKTIDTVVSSDDHDRQPRPTKRNRQCPQRVSSPPSEAVDQLFSSENENIGTRVPPRKKCRRQKQKTSLAQRLLQAAVLTDADPIDSLVREVDRNISASAPSASIPIPMQTLGEHSSARSKPKRRLWTLIDPRTRDENSTLSSFASRARDSNIERKPLTRWPTQISIVSDEEDGEEQTEKKKRKIVAGRGRGDDEVTRKATKKKGLKACEPQAQATLLFVPLQEAETVLEARKKKMKENQTNPKTISNNTSSTKQLNRKPLEFEPITISNNDATSDRAPTIATLNDIPSVPHTTLPVPDAAPSALPVPVQEYQPLSSQAIIHSLLQNSSPDVISLHRPVPAYASARAQEPRLQGNTVNTDDYNTAPIPIDRPHATSSTTRPGTPALSLAPGLLPPPPFTFALKTPDSAPSRAVRRTIAAPSMSRISQPPPPFTLFSDASKTLQSQFYRTCNAFLSGSSCPLLSRRSLPSRSTNNCNAPNPDLQPQRPLSTYLDQFLETAKSVNISQTRTASNPTATKQRPRPRAAPRRERQLPTSTLNGASHGRPGLEESTSTEPIFVDGDDGLESELFERYEPAPDIDVLEILSSQYEYEVVLRSSPLATAVSEERKRRSEKEKEKLVDKSSSGAEKRPNTGVRRSMAGIRAFYDVR